MIGLDLVGTDTTVGASWWRRLMQRPNQRIVSSPTKVTVNPKGGASSVFAGNVLRMEVAGGTPWEATYMSPTGHVTDNPSSVTVYLADGSKQTFTAPQQVTAAGGTVTMLGSDDGPQSGDRVTRTQDAIDRYAEEGVTVKANTGTVRATSGAYADVNWDGVRKAERGVPVADLVVLGAAHHTKGTTMNGLDLMGADEGGLVDAGAGALKGVLTYFKKPDPAAEAAAVAKKAADEKKKADAKGVVAKDGSGLTAKLVGPVRVWHALVGGVAAVGGAWLLRGKK